MREKPDMPLTPVELFRRGIEITQEIRGRIEEARAYYLGRSSREPEEPLSEVFDPMRGPILRYFIATIRTINRTQFIERFCRTDAFREFRQSSADRLLNDIAKAFEVRERQLRGETAAPEHEFFTSQFERIERKIESEHEWTRQRIEETHGLIRNILSTLGTILSSITAAARQIIKSINTRNIDGLDITGPRSPECRDQVLAVVVFLANPKHLQNVHHACEITYRPIRNGYEDVERLYRWCHRNESRIWAWVETYRLNHDIE